MDEQRNYFTELKTVLQDYIQDRITLVKLQMAEKISAAVAGIIAGVLMGITGFFILIFLSITAGFYFASLTGSNCWGFAIVTGIYIVLFIIILILKKTVIEKKVIGKTLNGFFGKKGDR